MEKIQVGEVMLFKQEVLGGMREFQMFGVNNESGCWVSLNDVIEVLELSKNAKKRMRKRTDENDICKIFVERYKDAGNLDEYFIRDSVACEMILREREERRLGEQFIYDVIGELNGTVTYDLVDIKYSKEIKEFKDWLVSDDDMFIAHKKDDKINTWQGPSVDEALDILYKAGLEI